MDCLSDTVYVVDRYRERGCGPASDFARRHADWVVGVPWVVRYEFLRGAYVSNHAATEIRALADSFLTVFPTEATIVRACELYALLRRRNQMVGPYDLWVAACALEHGLPLLTRNTTEFVRIPNLKVIDYTAPSSPPD